MLRAASAHAVSSLLITRDLAQVGESAGGMLLWSRRMIRFNREFDPHTLKLIIFDLDGTLIDSRLDLIHSVNAMLRQCKRPELPDDVIASYVGDGAPMLVRRALGDPKHEALV